MIEYVFDHERMDSAVAAHEASSPTSADGSRAGGEDVVESLRQRIRRMQASTLDGREVPTLAALGELLPGGSVRSGCVYSIAAPSASTSPAPTPAGGPTRAGAAESASGGATTLALALALGAARAGAWCAVVGLPDLGVAAAAELGFELDRLVFVPRPGEQWLAVISALVDVVPLVVARVPAGVREGAVTNRLASRLRQREASLIVLGAWPQSEARLSVTESEWAGLGAGHGNLRARRVTVSAQARHWAGRERSRRIWLPDAEHSIRAVAAHEIEPTRLDPVQAAEPTRDSERSHRSAPSRVQLRETSRVSA